jgi:hypothetical protein
MEIYAAQYPRGYDFPINTLFWGAVIVVALVAACLLVRKASEGPRNRRKFDGAGAVNQQRVPATPAQPITAQSRPVTKPHRRLAEPVSGETVEGGHIKDPENDPLVNILFRSGPEGFSEREEEEFLLIHGPRKVRKAIRERRHAREQAQKKQSQS